MKRAVLVQYDDASAGVRAIYDEIIRSEPGSTCFQVRLPLTLAVAGSE